MKIEQVHWSQASGWSAQPGRELGARASLVLAFGGTGIMADAGRYEEIRSCYPAAEILLCSTAGEISGTEVFDDTLVLTAVQFEEATLRATAASIQSRATSYATGRLVADSFPREGLVHLLVISDGQQVNGSELVRGMNESLGEGVSVTGGLAGDGSRFQRTLVGLNEAPAEGRIAALEAKPAATSGAAGAAPETDLGI